MKLRKRIIGIIAASAMVLPLALSSSVGTVQATTKNLFPQSKFYDSLNSDELASRSTFYENNKSDTVPQTGKDGIVHQVSKFSGITPSDHLTYWIDPRIPATQQGIIRQAVNDWSTKTHELITFSQVDSPSQAYIMYDFDDQDHTSGGLTWHIADNTGAHKGVFHSAVIQVNHDLLTSSKASIELYEHETGHALGLTDTDIDYNTAPDYQKTVMGKNVKEITNFDYLSIIGMNGTYQLQQAIKAWKK